MPSFDNVLKSVVEITPFEQHILQSYSLYKSIHSKIMTWIVSGRYYESLIDPFKLYCISPDKIKYILHKRREIMDYPHHVSEVIGGDWDICLPRFEEYDLHESFKNHFINEVTWEETKWYRRVVNQINKGVKNNFGCRSESEFKERCKQIDDLYKSIKKNGYLTQRELHKMNSNTPLQQHWSKYSPSLNEISINIGRNGELIFHEGRHRLSIAKILDVGLVPVRVKIRHKDWQLFRDEVATSPTQNNFDHPDLEYL